MNPLYTQLQPEIDKALAHYGTKIPQFATTPGAPLPDVDWVGLVTKFVGSIVNLVGQVAGATSEQRKQVVIDATMAFYTQTIKPYLETAIGRPFIFNTFIGPAIERALPGIIGRAYDALSGMILVGPPATGTTPAFQPY